jgi:hypothetical protein
MTDHEPCSVVVQPEMYEPSDLHATIHGLGVSDGETVHVRFTRSRTVFHVTWPPDAETIRFLRKLRSGSRYRRRYERGRR